MSHGEYLDAVFLALEVALGEMYDMHRSLVLETSWPFPHDPKQQVYLILYGNIGPVSYCETCEHIAQVEAALS
jgi:hypothetical protein